jgi:tetratricopeptide (TPR) repeat protein
MMMLIGCAQKPIVEAESVSSSPTYYAYNPEDTIGNEPFLQMLRIDSVRVDYRREHPISQISSINFDGLNGDDRTDEQRLRDDSVVHSEAALKWKTMMRLCSQKQYEELLSMYIKEETDIGIALATSTNKFELDYFVIGRLLFEQLDSEEAAEILSRFLEYDKFLTESVVAFSTAEGGSGYIPPQYAFQLETLCRTYLIMGDREKAEALIEPYRKAIYLLSDDVLWNENMIAKFKTNIYEEFGDLDKIIETAAGYRDFLIQYAKDTDQNFDEEIRLMDSLVKKWEN